MSAQDRLQNALRSQRFDRDRVLDQQAQLHVELVQTLIAGPGEAEADMKFACRFLDKPHVGNPTFDLHPDGNCTIVANNFPVLTGGVHFFYTEEVKPGLFHYIGARMVFVSSGQDGMLLTAHCRFEGKALVGPGVINGGLVT